MKAAYYFVLLLLGLTISIPMTVILIGYEQALDTKEKIQKFMENVKS